MKRGVELLLALFFVLMGFSLWISPILTGFAVQSPLNESVELAAPSQAVAQASILQARLAGKPHTDRVSIQQVVERDSLQDIDAAFTSQGKQARIEIRGAAQAIDRIQAVALPATVRVQNSDVQVRTDAVAVNSIEFEDATITLPRTGDVNIILHCADSDWDEVSGECAFWEDSGLTFTQDADFVTFSVNHFSAFAGGYVDEEGDSGTWTGTKVDLSVTVNTLALTTGFDLGTYESNTLDAGQNANWSYMNFTGSLGDGNITFQAASSSTDSGFTFVGPDGTASTYYNVTGFNTLLPLNLSINRYFRYKLFFDRGGTTSPSLTNAVTRYHFVDDNNATSDTTRLEIFDENEDLGYYSGQNMTVYANYTNFTSGSPISTGACSIVVDLGLGTDVYPLTYNPGDGIYNRSIWTNSQSLTDLDYSVNCSAAGYDTLNVSQARTIRFACDEGTTDDECLVTTSHLLIADTHIKGDGNITVNSSGFIGGTATANSYIYDVVVNVSGNVDVLGEIRTGFVDAVSAGQAGDVTIYSSVLNISGTVGSIGPRATSSPGSAGTVTLNTDELFLTGTITAVGEGSSSRRVGVPGEIIITATNFTSSQGTLSAHAKDGFESLRSGGEISLNTSTLTLNDTQLLVSGSSDLSLTSTELTGGDGGVINITTDVLAFDAVSLIAYGGNGDGSLAGAGGTITVQAQNASYSGTTLSLDLSLPGEIGEAQFIILPGGYATISGFNEWEDNTYFTYAGTCPFYNETTKTLNSSAFDSNHVILDNYGCLISGTQTIQNLTIRNNSWLFFEDLTITQNITFENSTISGFSSQSNLSVNSLVIGEDATLRTIADADYLNLTIADNLTLTSTSQIYTFGRKDADAPHIYITAGDTVNNTGTITSQSESYDSQHNLAGEIRITADHLSSTGLVESKGVTSAGAPDYNIGIDGGAGNSLNFSATTAYIAGTLYTRGADPGDTAGSDGGDGGDVLIQTSSILFDNPTVDLRGNNGRDASCSQPGNGGDGGDFTLIASNVTYSSGTYLLDGGSGCTSSGVAGSFLSNSTHTQINTTSIDVDFGSNDGTIQFNILSSGTLLKEGVYSFTPSYVIERDGQCPYYNTTDGRHTSAAGLDSFINVSDFTCDYSGTQSITRLQLTSPGVIQGSSLDLTVSDNFTVSSGTMTANTLDVGRFLQEAGTLTASGTIDAGNFTQTGGTLTSDAITVVDAFNQTAGTATLSGNLDASRVLANGTITLSATGLAILADNITILNAGTVSTGSATYDYTLDADTSLLTQSGSLLTFPSPSSNDIAGTLHLLSPNVTLGGSITSRGALASHTGTSPQGEYAATINITADSAAILGTISLTGLGTTNSGLDAGAGGNVYILANTTLCTGTITSTGGANTVNVGHGGHSGILSVTSPLISLSDCTLTFDGGASTGTGGANQDKGGNGGSILFNSSNTTILVSSISADGGSSASSSDLNGRGGSITLIASDVLNITHSTLTARTGTRIGASSTAGTLALETNNATLLLNSTFDLDATTVTDGDVSITRECGFERSVAFTNVNTTNRTFYTSLVESDSDVIANSCDNCILVDNLDQNDTYDGDGVGDACDAHISFLLDGQNDTFVDINQDDSADPANTFRLYAEFINDQTGNLYGVGDGNNPSDIDFFTVNITNASSGSEIYSRSLSSTNTLTGDQVNGRILLAQFVPTTYNLTFTAQATGSAGTIADEINTTLTFKNITFTSSMASTNINNGTPVTVTLTAKDEDDVDQNGTVNLTSDEFSDTSFVLDSGAPKLVGTTTTLGLHELTFNLIMPLLRCVNHSSCLTGYTEQITQSYETFLATNAEVNVTGLDEVDDSIIDVDDGNIIVRAAYYDGALNPINGTFNITLRNSTFSTTQTCGGLTQSICEKNFSTANLGLTDALGTTYTVIVNISNDPANYRPQDITTPNVLLRNISVDSELDANRYFEGDVFTVNGTTLRVGTDRVTGGTAYLFIDGVLNTSTSVITGPPSIFEFTNLDVPSGGTHNLIVRVNDSAGISGEDTLTLGVFELMNLSSAYTYTLLDGNLTVFANYTNSTGGLQEGNINITVTDADDDEQTLTCSGTAQCVRSFNLGEQETVDAGNITIFIIAENESSFFNTTTETTEVFLEAKDTIADFNFPRVVITDRTLGDLIVNATFTVTNDGNGNLTAANITLEEFLNEGEGGTALTTTVTANQTFFLCGDLAIGESCTFNVTINISEQTPNIDVGAVFRVNHTNNDGTITSRQTDATGSDAVIEIAGVPVLEVNNVTDTQQHATTQSYIVRVNNTGNEIAEFINFTFEEISWSSDLNVTLTAVEATLLDGLLRQVCDFLNIFLGEYGCDAAPWLSPYEELNLTITAAPGTAPGVYTSRVEFSDTSGLTNPDRLFATTYSNIAITIPVNGSWTLEPLASNNSLPLNKQGVIQDYIINNTGNINLNFSVVKTGFASILAADQETQADDFSVAKQTSDTLTLRHTALSSSNTYSGTVTLSNSSATPTSRQSTLNITVENQVPVVTLINQSDDPIDVNRALVLYYNASNDDLGQTTGLPTSLAGCNATLGITTLNSAATQISVDSNGFVKVFSCSLTLNESGTWTIKPFATDNVSQVGNTSFTIEAIGTTTATVTPNTTSVSVEGVSDSSSQSFFLNVTALNTGDADMYNAIFSAVVSGIPGATVNTDSISLIENGTSDSGIIEVVVPAGTTPFTYTITPRVTWTNADGTSAQQLSLQTISVTVEEFVQIDLVNTTSTITAAQHNSTLTLTYTVSSAGNTDASNVEFLCVGECFSSTFSPSSISTLSGTQQVNQTFTIPSGQSPDTYNFVTIARAAGADQNGSVSGQLTVVGNASWMAVPTSVSQQYLAAQSPSIGFTIFNFANQQLNFTFDVVGSLSSIAATPSGFNLAAATNGAFDLDLNTPSTTQTTTGTLNISCASCDPSYQEVPVSIETYNITIANISLSPSSDVSPSDSLSIGFLAALDGTPLTTANFDDLVIEIGGVNATITNTAYNAPYFNLTVTAPSVGSQLLVDVNLTGNYTPASFNHEYALGQVTYLDLLSPTLANESTPDTPVGNAATISVDVTDNDAVDTVTATVGGSTYTLTPTGNTYSATLPVLSEGDYPVTFTANDTQGNTNTLDGYLIVYTNVTLTGTLDPAGDLDNITIEFINPNNNDTLFNETFNESYSVTVYVHEYDLIIYINDARIRLNDVPNASIAGQLIQAGIVPEATRPSSDVTNLEGFGIVTAISFGSGDLSFLYDSGSIGALSDLDIYRCADWNLTTKTCTSGTWTALGASSGNGRTTANITSFSAYIFGQAQASSGGSGSGSGGGGGGGGGVSRSTFEEGIQGILDQLAGISIDTQAISLEVLPGELVETDFEITNKKSTGVAITPSVEGNVRTLSRVSPTSMTLETGGSGTFTYHVRAPESAAAGLVQGKILLDISGSELAIPVTIRILESRVALAEPEVSIQALTRQIVPNGTLSAALRITNPEGFYGRFDAEIEATNIATGAQAFFLERIYEGSDPVADTLTINLTGLDLGEYNLKAKAHYTARDGVRRFVTDQDSFKITPEPITLGTLLFAKFWLFTVWQYLAALLLLGLLVAAAHKGREYWELHKKYQHIIVDHRLLPQHSDRTAYVGMVAETSVRTFVELESMMTHTIIAGATGGGKTVSAQGIVEEALDHDVAVVVFDPTGQWSGFLRPCTDKSMLKLYSHFGMSTHDAKAYKGNIFQIENPREYLDLKSKIKPGFINIINISKIDPKELDIFVANTIRQIFKMNLPESRTLKTLFVYDEVHRLLPKFGGSGAGFIQIERACREFRKWGVGMLLVSQVLSDFVGEIKANINTEIQMRTKSEGDLERVKNKYGEAILHALVKASVGTGMIQNAEYNKGRPYLISFRPLKHNTQRLSDKELNLYAQYNNQLADIEYQIKQLKDLKQDTFDVELELKLAKDKLMEGKFTMVDIYVDGLVTKLKSQFAAAGATPTQRQIELIPQEEIEADIAIAKQERDRYTQEMIKKHGKDYFENRRNGVEKPPAAKPVRTGDPIHDFLARERAKGHSDEEIRKKLTSHGWSDAQVDRLLTQTQSAVPAQDPLAQLETRLNTFMAKVNVKKRDGKDLTLEIDTVTIPGDVKLTLASQDKQKAQQLLKKMDELEQKHNMR